MKFGMNHIHVKSEDPRQAARWYVENLGAEIEGEAAINDSLTVRANLGGVRVNITQAPPEGLPAGTSEPRMGLEHFGLETGDLDEAMTTLQAKGVKVIEPIRSLPNGMRIAFIEAPDNVRLELMQLP